MNENRELGSVISISIGTAVPIEMLLQRTITPGYGYFYINISTLFRNFYASYKVDTIPSSKNLIIAFIKEFDMLKAIITESIPGNIKPIFYITTYRSLQSCFKKAKLHIPSTPKQKNYDELERTIVSKFVDKVPDIQIFDGIVKGNNCTAFILTHKPLDLLSNNTFRKLSLIESHTGTIKNKTEWITKISKKEEDRNIPFNILTIQVLGDRGNHLESLGRKITHTFSEFAKANNWSAITTLEKIKHDIRTKMLDKALATLLLEMAIAKLK